MSKLKELRESRARNHNELVQVLNGADSSESREKAKKLIAAIDEAKIEIDGLSTVGENSAMDTNVEYRKAFLNYMRRGENGITQEQRTVLQERRSIGEGYQPDTLGTVAQLGYFVPQGFVYDVEVATKW